MQLVKQIKTWEDYGKASKLTCMIAFVAHHKHGIVEIHSSDLSAIQFISMLAMAIEYEEYEVWTYAYN